MILLDTGPLVAVLDRQDTHHRWAIEQFKQLPLPLYSCEAVLTEAAHLLKRAQVRPTLLFPLVTSSALILPYDVDSDINRVAELMKQYADRPMDFADACLVHMSEQYPSSKVLTTDVNDFSTYRRFRDQPIPIITPEYP